MKKQPLQMLSLKLQISFCFRAAEIIELEVIEFIIKIVYQEFLIFT